MSIKIPEKLLKRWVREDEEAKRLRMKYADWGFIEKQPVRLREALKYYIKTGDIRMAAILAGLNIEEFNILRREANIPSI